MADGREAVSDLDPRALEAAARAWRNAISFLAYHAYMALPEFISRRYV